MGGNRGALLKMIIPNNTVRQQYWGFMRKFYERTLPIVGSKLNEAMVKMGYDGDWHPMIDTIAIAYKANSSVRDAIRGEHNLQGFFKAYLALNPLYVTSPEHELNYGYCDFLLLPDLKRYGDIEHSYIMELKYVKPTATDEELKAKESEAESQLRQYAADANIVRQCGKTKLHLLKVIFRGAEVAICEEF